MNATLAVARLNFANGLRQPMTWLVVALGITLVLLSYLFGMFSFEDSSRMRLLITAGVATSVICGCFLGVVSVAQAVHDELSSRTALTLFAKPIPRHSFLLGKVIGTAALLLVATGLIVAAHLLMMYFAQQAGFDLSDRHRQYHRPEDVGYMPWGGTIVGHVLGLCGNLTLVCLAAALALKVPMAASVVITFAVFVLANLVAASGFSSIVVFPALQLFNVDDALHFSDVDITPTYFILSGVHALLYGGACLIIGVSVLQRQDIP